MACLLSYLTLPAPKRPLRNLLLFLFSHRFLAIARWEIHFLGIRLWNTFTGGRRRIQRVVAIRGRPLFLNFGSGPRGLADARWINVDGFRAANVDALLDCSRPLPFLDESFDGVFCEHVLEHFSEENGLAIAREILRILDTGGCFRIVVPDGERVIRLYLESPEALVAWRGTGDRTPMGVVNTYFRQRYEHQFLYDWQTLKAMLECAGFSAVSRASYREGLHERALVIDDTKYEWESLYVEAVK